MSNLPSDTPRLPKWIFLVSDAVLIAAAWFITANNTGHLVGWPLLAVFGLFVIGVALAVIPYLADYVREQAEALHERQNALEALSRTVATSAEQISIAANGLHELLELSHRNLKQAEQLPHKLQEKIAEFQQLLATANDEEKEELERELATLRSSDSERLEATADKVHKAAADWAKLEAATAKHLSATNEELGKLAGAAEAGAGKLTQAAETAVAKASAETAKALAAAYSGGANAIDNKLAASLAEIDVKLAKSAGQLTVRATDAAALFDAKLATLETAIARLDSAFAKAGTGAVAPAARSSVLEQSSSDLGVPLVISPEPVTGSEPATATPVEAPSPKRARKPRREEPTEAAASTDTVASDAPKPDTATEVAPESAPPVSARVDAAPAAASAPASASETISAHAGSDPQSAIPNLQLEEPK